MIGNETAELAAHIASSVRDHCGDPDILSVNCASLVDEDFDEETVIEKDLYYKCPEPAAEHLRETAVWIVREKIRQTMEKAVGKTNFHFQLTRVMFVIVADAAGSYQLSDLDSLRATLIAEMEAEGKRAGALLCIKADNEQAYRQRRWLMTEDDCLRKELDRFDKVLILTPSNMKGFTTVSTARDMLDVAFPALIMLMNGHQITDPVRLYTASYRKQGGTSSDIRELRRHIAARTLDGFFANPGALNRQAILEILSTDKIRLDGTGTTLKEKVMSGAERFTPQLRHLVLTADLESESFDPIRHIVEFDELNRDKMAGPGDWPEEWLQEMEEKILRQIHLDAIYHQLDENNPDGMVTEILQTWGELMAEVTGEKAQKQDYLENRMAGCLPSLKKGLFQKMRDYNLIQLSAAVGIYSEICRERIAYRMLTCLQKGLAPLREFLKEAISRRQEALKRYQMDDSKLRILREMCPAAAAELEESYGRPKLIDTLPTFIQHRSRLYSETEHSYWPALYHEFLNKGTQTSSFSEAFIMKANKDHVRRKIEPLGEDVPAMIPGYPDELGALPLPVKAFLLNDLIAEMLPDTLQDSQVFRVPGDLLEHVSLFPISRSMEPLAKLAMFRKVSGYSGYDPTAVMPKAVTGKGKQKTGIREPAEKNDLNPWNIRIKDSPKGSGMMLCWEYPSDHGNAVIHINDKIIQDSYSYTEYIRNGKGIHLEDGQVSSGELQIRIECGEEYQQYDTVISIPGEKITIEPGGIKAKGNNGVEVMRGTAYDDRYENRCLVFSDDRQQWRIPFYVDDHGAISPLWCSENDELELIDL